MQCETYEMTDSELAAAIMAAHADIVAAKARMDDLEAVLLSRLTERDEKNAATVSPDGLTVGLFRVCLYTGKLSTEFFRVVGGEPREDSR